ncbi:MAG: efflux RND transporter periplasmic adaptor subunit [Cyclobacteriaceae bacterium]
MRAKNDGKDLYVTEVVLVRNLKQEIISTGTLEAVETVDVGTQVSGIISKLYADFNDEVKKGQVIALLDTVLLSLQVAEMKANYDKAKAQFDQMELNYLRNRTLFNGRTISESDFEVAKFNYLSAKAAMDLAHVQFMKAEKSLGYAIITSPISGLVLARNVSVGQTVAANFAAPVLFTIIQTLRDMELHASIDEADISYVKVGQLVSFSVDAYPHEKFLGTVKEIRLNPTSKLNVVTYTIIIDAPNEQMKLLPGMNSDISVVVQQQEQALSVPLAALGYKKEEDSEGEAIWIMKHGRPARMPIEKYFDNGTFAAIKGAVKAGDTVVIGERTVEEIRKKNKRSLLPDPGSRP